MHISSIVKSKTQVGLVGFTALACVLLLGHFASASLLGPDRTNKLHPLVRHNTSQVHCYDSGTDQCEVAGFQKEFTLGYLAMQKKANTTELYKCVRPDANLHFVTTNRKECRQSPWFSTSITNLGFIFKDSNLEASMPLYRCLNSDKTDTLLTDDPAECSILSYDPPTPLGYVIEGAGLPQRRLNNLCQELDSRCASSPTGALGEICDLRAGLCKGPQ